MATEGEWLPGYVENGTAVRSVYGSLIDALKQDEASKAPGLITLCYYAAKVAGWRKIAPQLKAWKAGGDRSVRAFIGTDSGLTDPAALDEMVEAGVELFLLTDYVGVYHPKVIHWATKKGERAWIGSHNLSGAGLEDNIEFGVHVTGNQVAAWTNWMAFLKTASIEGTKAEITAYRKEREAFVKAHKAPPRFVWSKRKSPAAKGKTKVKAKKPILAKLEPDVLVMELMGRETGAGGKQIQPPIKSLAYFGGLKKGGSKILSARLKGDPVFHDLTLSHVENSTARLHIAELDYGDRPGFILFRREGKAYVYEIVSEASQPVRYQQLDALPLQKTQEKSRRWMITK